MNLDGDARSSQSHRRLHRCRVLRSSRVEVLVQLVTFHLLLQHVTSSIGTCDIGWTFISGSCYSVKPPMSWNNLSQVCNSLNSSITDIRSGIEDMDVHQYLRSLGIYAAWIGLNDLQNEGQWQWESGSYVTYINWGSGEPNGNRNENCAVTTNNNDFHGWNDFVCNTPLRGVCKKTGPCSTGWTPRSGLCYNVTDSQMSWSDVRQSCRSLGGSIADISSITQDYDINEHLRTRGINRAWIGLFKNSNNSNWMWESGINVTYTNWGINEPNYQHGNEFCGETWSAPETTWRDLPCDSLFHGVCKKEAYVYTTEKPTTAIINTPSTVVTTSFTTSDGASYTSTPSYYPSVGTSSRSSSPAESTLRFESDVWFIPDITVTLLCTTVAAALGIRACRTRFRFATGRLPNCQPPAVPPSSDGRPHIAAVELPSAPQLHCASFSQDFACYASLAFHEDNCYASLSQEKNQEKNKRSPSNEYHNAGICADLRSHPKMKALHSEA